MDIQAILETAKHELLTTGATPPTLLIEWDNGDVDRLRFTSFPGVALQNQQLLFAVGREYGILHRQYKPVSLCFVNEMWFQEYDVDDAPTCLPSEDPNRKEMLVLLTLIISDKTLSQQMRAYEMIRGAGTVDLLLHETSDGSVESKLLLMVLAGISTAHLSDRALGRMIERYAKG